MEIKSVISDIKKRLQDQQAVLGRAASDDDYVRLAVRAEQDALWSAVEVLAQILDGADISDVVIRNYFTDRPVIAPRKSRFRARRRRNN